MASIWFTVSIIFGVISQIITIPLGKVSQQQGYVGLNEQAQREQAGRVRRTVNSIPTGCKKDVKFVIINVTDCPVTNSKYDVGRKLCLEKIAHVPGMPDGPKGYIYIAINHYLYKTYRTTTRPRLVKCPIAAVAPTTDLATSPPSKTVNPTTASQNVLNEISTQAGIQNTSGNVSTIVAKVMSKPTTKVAKVMSKPTTKANITLST